MRPILVALGYYWRLFIRWLTGGRTGWCLRCGREWGDAVIAHHTYYGVHPRTQRGAWGCFPLCEPCWTTLGTPERRLPFYRLLWQEWLSRLPQEQGTWDRIEAAVRREDVTHGA